MDWTGHISTLEEITAFANETVEGSARWVKDTFKDMAERTLDFLRTRKQAYMLAFGSPAGRLVLADLAKFCRANQSTFDADPRVSANWDGRREVFLRITQHLHLTDGELYNLLNP